MKTAKPRETGRIVSLQERGDPFWDDVRGGGALLKEFRIHYHLAGGDTRGMIGGMGAASARHWIRV